MVREAWICVFREVHVGGTIDAHGKRVKQSMPELFDSSPGVCAAHCYISCSAIAAGAQDPARLRGELPRLWCTQGVASDRPGGFPGCPLDRRSYEVNYRS